jgi:hypothetical protein
MSRTDLVQRPSYPDIWLHRPHRQFRSDRPVAGYRASHPLAGATLE